MSRPNQYIVELKTFLLSKSPDTEIVLTTRCNSRCNICTYWRQKKRHMPLRIVKRILDSKHTFYSVCLSGGEAILHPKIADIITLVKQYDKFETYALMTNGLMTDRILDLASRYEIPEVNVSLDTLDRQSYRNVRGVDGSKKVVETIRLLKDLTHVSINFTISPYNSREDLIDVLRFAKEEGVGIFVAVYNERDRLSTKKAFEPFRFRDLAKSYFLDGWVEWHNGLHIPCLSVRGYCEVMPNGNVYFCPNSKNENPDGNLDNNSLDEIWEMSRKRVKGLINCSECFLSCNRGKDYWFYKHPMISSIIKWI